MRVVTPVRSAFFASRMLLGNDMSATQSTSGSTEATFKKAGKPVLIAKVKVTKGTARKIDHLSRHSFASRIFSGMFRRLPFLHKLGTHFFHSRFSLHIFHSPRKNPHSVYSPIFVVHLSKWAQQSPDVGFSGDGRRSDGCARRFFGLCDGYDCTCYGWFTRRRLHALRVAALDARWWTKPQPISC